MALPSLPTQGQDPWFTTRDTFDRAVRDQITGLDSRTTELEVLTPSLVRTDELVINVLDHGVVGDGVTDDSGAILTLFASTPPGGTVLFPGGRKYLISQRVLVTGKSINVSARGAQFLYTSSNSGFTFEGGFDPSIAVTSLTSNVVTPNSHEVGGVQVVLGSNVPTTWRRGDIVRVYANDVIPGSRDFGDPSVTNHGRVAQYLQVLSYSGNTVQLLGVLDDTYSIGVRVARLKTEIRCSWIGGDFDYTDGAMAETISGNSTLEFSQLYRPEVHSVGIRRFPRMAVQVSDCHSWKAQADIGYGINNLDLSRFGYGLACYASSYGTYYNSRVGQVRHGYINGHLFLTDAEASAGTPNRRGRPHDNTIINITVENPTGGGAFDSHTSGLRERFIGCHATNARVGFSLRGRDHTVQSCSAAHCGVAVSLIQERVGGISYGHQINDLRCDNVGSIFTSLLGTISGSNTFQTLVTIPTVINGVRARGVTGREFDVSYSTVKMRGWDVRRSPASSPGRASKSVLDVADYTVDLSDVLGVTSVIHTEAFNSGAGDRNSVRLRDIKVLNSSSNLSYVVTGSGADSARVSSSRVESTYPPVSGVMSHAFVKVTPLSFVADYV